MARPLPAQARLHPPQLDADALRPGPDLYNLFGAEERFDLDEPAAQDAVFEGGDASYTAGRGAEFRRCVLRRCNFRGAQWKNAAFVDVVFEQCDFSNARLPESFFQRVRFKGCKLVGADLVGASLRSVSLQDCQMRMVNLNTAKLNAVSLTGCDAREAAMQSISEFKSVALAHCDLTAAELLGTRLAGVDLTDCRIDGILLSGQAELRGAIVTPLQALALSRLLGIVIKE